MWDPFLFMSSHGGHLPIAGTKFLKELASVEERVVFTYRFQTLSLFCGLVTSHIHYGGNTWEPYGYQQVREKIGKEKVKKSAVRTCL